MTTQTLFTLIIMTVLLQLLIYGAIASYRQWLLYQQLESKQITAPAPTTAWQGTRKFRVQRKVFEDADQTICSFYLSPEDKRPLPSFLAGQYLTFEFQLPDISGGQTKKTIRCYSLSDKPGLDHYRISVKRVPPPANKPDIPAGLVSNYLHTQVNEGDVLLVKAPAGHFCWAENITEPMVLIAGGIGITPVLSMLLTALEHDPEREIWFFYGVRNGAEHIMKTTLEMLAKQHANLHLHVCYSQPAEADRKERDYQHAARVDIKLLRAILPLKTFQFFVCGPPPMMESLIPALETWGIPDHQIHYEAFGPASIKRRHAAETVTMPITEKPVIRFSQSNKELPWDDKFTCLLEFAEHHNIKVDFGCRAGSCGSCQTIIESGEVIYQQEADFDVPTGSCLLCIARPRTNLTLRL